MPAYDVSVRCKHCNQDHPVLLRLYVTDGPRNKQSLADSFRGRPLPPQVKAIHWHRALCYKTGKTFPLEDDNEIFLVPQLAVGRESIIQKLAGIAD